MRIYCPHCRSFSTIRTAKKFSPLLSDHYAGCTNPDCDHKFVVRTEIVYTTRASLSPDPEIHLRMSPRISNAEEKERASDSQLPKPCR